MSIKIAQDIFASVPLLQVSAVSNDLTLKSLFEEKLFGRGNNLYFEITKYQDWGKLNYSHPVFIAKVSAGYSPELKARLEAELLFQDMVIESVKGQSYLQNVSSSDHILCTYELSNQQIEGKNARYVDIPIRILVADCCDQFVRKLNNLYLQSSGQVSQKVT